MPSCTTYRLTWVSLTLDVGYLSLAAPAKHSRCSLPWLRGVSSGPCCSNAMHPLLFCTSQFLLPLTLCCAVEMYERVEVEHVYDVCLMIVGPARHPSSLESLGWICSRKFLEASFSLYSSVWQAASFSLLALLHFLLALQDQKQLTHWGYLQPLKALQLPKWPLEAPKQLPGALKSASPLDKRLLNFAWYQALIMWQGRSGKQDLVTDHGA